MGEVGTRVQRWSLGFGWCALGAAVLLARRAVHGVEPIIRETLVEGYPVRIENEQQMRLILAEQERLHRAGDPVQLLLLLALAAGGLALILCFETRREAIGRWTPPWAGGCWAGALLVATLAMVLTPWSGVPAVFD
jgi:hypothetical protein